MRESLFLDQGSAAPVVDHIKGPEVVAQMIDTGASKADLSVGNIFVRGMYGGALLAFATSIAFYATAQTGLPIVGALLFPVGFSIITLLGMDLITGYFAITPLALIHGRLTVGQLARAWIFVWAGNLAGAVLYAVIMWAGYTMTGSLPGGGDNAGLAAITTKIGLAKTVHYEQFAFAGAFAAFLKGMLCNWMVTLGVVLPMASRSAIGKVLGTYIPIFMFFAMGYEHMVVNMFIIPAAMLFGAPITMSDFWIGNELPVTLGNAAGGFLFTGAAIGWVYRSRRTVEEPIPPLPRPATV